MHRRLVFGTLLVFCCCLFTAQAEQRLALVIGNAAYADAPLANPVNDARLIAGSLRQVGFRVTERTNLDQNQLREAIQSFGDQLASAGKDGVGFVYYSGHGVQAGGRNYLIPVGANIRKESDLELRAVDASTLMAQMEDAGAGVNILVLDACRNNPFQRSTKSLSKGLARMDSREGSFYLAYATAPDTEAQDGGGANSPYAAALASAMLQPGQPIEEIFKQVRIKVLAATLNQQRPWDSSSLLTDFYFKPGAAAQIASLSRPPPTEKPSAPAPEPATPLTTTAPLTSYRDCSDCPQMVYIPAGSFMMGSPANETYRENDEGPQHTVQIPAFSIGQDAVTFDEWDACVAAGGCATRPNDERWGRGRRPVINVSWNDAQQYAKWISGKTGHIYRLPSEAEWEYAARAGTTTAYWWGDFIGIGHANCDGCGSQWDNKGTAPVGSFAPNPWGLNDMLGNVWQWTQDCWNESYAGAPTDGSAWTSGDCARRVARGGSWFAPPRGLRAASRAGGPASAASGYLGFRLARTD